MGLGEARTNGVGGDAAASEFERERSSQTDDAVLGGAICGDIGVAGQARRGGDIDEPRAGAVTLEVRQRRMRDIVDAGKID